MRIVLTSLSSYLFLLLSPFLTLLSSLNERSKLLERKSSIGVLARSRRIVVVLSVPSLSVELLRNEELLLVGENSYRIRCTNSFTARGYARSNIEDRIFLKREKDVVSTCKFRLQFFSYLLFFSSLLFCFSFFLFSFKMRNKRDTSTRISGIAFRLSDEEHEMYRYAENAAFGPQLL